MPTNVSTDRLNFLAEKFDVFDSNPETIKTKVETLAKEGWDTKIFNASNSDAVFALISEKPSEFKKPIRKVSVSVDVFSDIIAADPTVNRIFIQWMLNIFTRFLRLGDTKSITSAIRFVEEDLPSAHNYLTLFEAHKRKQKFKALSVNTLSLKGITDLTDINQYKSLSQVFDAVDPMVEKNSSEMEQLMERFVNAGQAEIPARDRKFIVYVPKTKAASEIWKETAWCTARKDNGMFKSYTENHRKPNGKPSDIYIIVNTKFFTEESDELFQIHFETNQIRNKSNGSENEIFEKVIRESETLANFFYVELMQMAKMGGGIEGNKYLDYLLEFGFAESIFELLEEDTPTIKFIKRKISQLPDLSRFKQLDQLIIIDAGLTDLPASIGELSNVEMLSLTNNKLKELPKEIGKLKKMNLLNLQGNRIKDIPDEIQCLDLASGGALHFLGVKEKEIGVENYSKLKRLLPNVAFYEGD